MQLIFVYMSTQNYTGLKTHIINLKIYYNRTHLQGVVLSPKTTVPLNSFLVIQY